MRRPLNNTCERCGMAFRPHRANQRFCDDRCRRRAPKKRTASAHDVALLISAIDAATMRTEVVPGGWFPQSLKPKS